MYLKAQPKEQHLHQLRIFSKDYFGIGAAVGVA